MMREYICPIPQGTEFHIKMAPILREEIVRCCDCRYFTRDYIGNGEDATLCVHWNNGKADVWIVDPDGFCAWAERVD